MINDNQELINMVMNLPNLNISIIDAHQMGNIIINYSIEIIRITMEKRTGLVFEGNVYDVYEEFTNMEKQQQQQQAKELIDHLSIPLMKLPKLSTMESFQLILWIRYQI